MSRSDDDNDRKPAKTISRFVQTPAGSKMQPPGKDAADSDREAPAQTQMRDAPRRAPVEKRPAETRAESPPTRRAAPVTRKSVSDDAIRSRYINPSAPNTLLLDEASALLALGGYLRDAEKPKDLDQLRREIVDAVARYTGAIESYYGQNTVSAASFCVCAFLDDCVLRTFWGRESGWARQSVLAEVHQFAHRGDLIQRIEADLDSPRDPALFALYHTVLSLGFEAPEGDDQRMLRLRERVYREVQAAVPEASSALVDSSMVAPAEGQALSRRLPAWAVVAAAGVVIALLYAGFHNLLAPQIAQFESVSADLSARQSQLRVVDFFPDAQAPPTPVAPDLYVLLAPQIESGDIELYDAQPGTRILMRSDGMFASGSANFKAKIQPLLKQVSDVLAETPGPIMVEGHTDNVPFRSALSNNQTLSTQRAEQVASVLGSRPDNRARLRARGYAERAPLACNDTPQGRRRNRRVEIVLPVVITDGAPSLPRPECGVS